MAAYSWQALDSGGKTREGVSEADSARQLRQQLRRQGLTPLAVEVVDGRQQHQRLVRLANAERVLILRQLATLSRAGLPLDESLATVAEQSEKAISRRLLASLRSAVLEGRSLASAMADFPRHFPRWLRASIDAGERSGQLDRVLERLAGHAEQRLSISRRLGMTLIYPLVVLVVAVIVVISMMLFVVPKVTGVFSGSGAELPLLTRMMMTISGFLASYGIYLLLGLVLLTGLLFHVWRQPRGRQRLEAALLRLPGFGRFIRALNTARFTRTLSLLVSSSVPLAEALPVAVRAMPNAALRAQLASITRRVVEGASLGQAMRESDSFPPLVLRLVDVGETSGELDSMLERASLTQEENLTAVSETLVGLLQPVMIILVGGFVLLIVLAVMLPILNANQVLG